MAQAIDNIQSNTGVPLTDVYGDRMYRGNDYDGDAFNAILAAAASNFRKLYRLAASCADLSALIYQIGEGWCAVRAVIDEWLMRLAVIIDRRPADQRIAA